MVNIKKISPQEAPSSLLHVGHAEGSIKTLLQPEEYDYLQRQLAQEKNPVFINRYSHIILYIELPEQNSKDRLEELREKAYKSLSEINAQQIDSIAVDGDASVSADEIMAVIEGITLGSYRFLKYISKKSKKQCHLQTLAIKSDKITATAINELTAVIEETCKARDLINEPVITLNTIKLEEWLKQSSKENGFSLKILDKAAIEKEKMGGLLAVNKGSVDPPRFFIMEWHPEEAKNQSPYVIIGKGITYDTGGLSLKPSQYMEDMKSDMSGAAAVIGAIGAISRNKLPVHVIALVPATDNRPGEHAIAPGDIITMYDKTTVEVLNTDAEGRLILADALTYAQQYAPALTIDLATLTGAASRAIGKYAIVGMHNTSGEAFQRLQAAGQRVHERIVEFPLWDDYKELLKSSVADLKNIGGIDAGAITAGKFLEHFTQYPFIHLDIAGPAFVDSTYGYRGKGGTGIGVRVLYEFFQSITA